MSLKKNIETFLAETEFFYLSFSVCAESKINCETALQSPSHQELLKEEKQKDNEVAFLSKHKQISFFVELKRWYNTVSPVKTLVFALMSILAGIACRALYQ